MTVRLAVDIGGTFVDAVAFDGETGDLRLEKAPTTPADPSEGVLEAIHKLGVELEDVEAFIHGSTLGINAYLERKGSRTGILTTRGFRDVYEIGRTNVPKEAMYDITYSKPPTLVPRRRRVEVPGRLAPDGQELEPLDERAVANVVDRLVEDQEIETLAVCFLHSYQNPDHEERAAETVRERHPELSLSLSSAITREHREYERLCTAVLDAYIKPIFNSYVDKLRDALTARGFRGSFLFTRSGGGILPAESAKNAPVHTILSGPAGGLIGAGHVARTTGEANLISLDLGGTSLDTCVVEDGAPAVEYEASLDHVPFMIPVYDIRTIGAGGGSIAWLDEGLLKVGPESAGADPGPICYGAGGTEPTVTDAALVLGYLAPETFLGGTMRLDDQGAHTGIQEKLADPLGSDVLEVARGIFDVAVAKTVGAIREITVEKGLDPRDFAILAYGGAGPMVATLLGREMSVDRVVIPRAPSVFSAWGMLNADVVQDFSQTWITMLRDLDLATLDDLYRPLESKAGEALEGYGIPETSRRLERSAELRYRGQEHTVEVDAGDLSSVEELSRRFEKRHRARYGHGMDDPAQLVHLRVRGVGVIDKPQLKRAAPSDDVEKARIGSRSAYCFSRGALVDFGIYLRDRLGRGDTVKGPAIIQEATTTIVLHSDQVARVDDFGQLVVTG
ncbi:MAG: hydantoinase/oxoprolinase family protein [Gemmatimonadota bacterium]